MAQFNSRAIMVFKAYWRTKHSCITAALLVTALWSTQARAQQADKNTPPPVMTCNKTETQLDACRAKVDEGRQRCVSDCEAKLAEQGITSPQFLLFDDYKTCIDIKSALIRNFSVRLIPCPKMHKLIPKDRAKAIRKAFVEAKREEALDPNGQHVYHRYLKKRLKLTSTDLAHWETVIACQPTCQQKAEKRLTGVCARQHQAHNKCLKRQDKQYKKAREFCARSPNCDMKGHCTFKNGKCIIGSSEDCKKTKGCTQAGACTFTCSGDLATCLHTGRRCMPTSDKECQASGLCAEKGLCKHSSGRCVVGNDGHCQQSSGCAQYGFCKLSGKSCGPDSQQDCNKCLRAGQCTGSARKCVRKGRCSVDIIERVLKKRVNQMSSCYEKQLSLNRRLKGSLTVDVLIGLKGSVMKAAIKEGSLKNKPVQMCILRTFRRLRFPQPEGNVCRVQIPMSLKVKKRGASVTFGKIQLDH